TDEGPPTQPPTAEPTETALPPNPEPTSEAATESYLTGMIGALPIKEGFSSIVTQDTASVDSAVSLLVGAEAEEEVRTGIANQLESMYRLAQTTLGDGVHVEVVATAKHWAALVTD